MELFAPKVEICIRKYSRGRSEEDKQDLRQACFLAIIEAGDRVTNAAIAYLIARDTVIKILHRDNKEKDVYIQSMTDAAVFRKAEEKHFETPVYEIDPTEKLPPEEREVIRLLYGLGEVELTYEETAQSLNQTIGWVREREKSALIQLEELLK